jgi:hypothetical protein
LVTSVTWAGLEDGDRRATAAASFPAHLQACGVVFAAEVTRIGELRLPERIYAVSAPHLSLDSAPRGLVIVAALAILEDGKPRSANQILAEALARRLVPAQTMRKYVYTAQTEYIARTLGHGREPLLVQDVHRNFRSTNRVTTGPMSSRFPRVCLLQAPKT